MGYGLCFWVDVRVTGQNPVNIFPNLIHAANLKSHEISGISGQKICEDGHEQRNKAQEHAATSAFYYYYYYSDRSLHSSNEHSKAERGDA